ncbi:arsenic resistance protein [Dethiobacter alkaliphilus]|uniref:Bile acid:sodium symporter n=1 Tax=Dethiobacter alkaliphilus AHT 1 TaxID=555088 RepID=C0GC20_DETAL|nr:arsenic resistance protein [Dethiobacter alkaliphilus]EEG78755.1 Bile acid:sodium symporter [Dethiobacter alkaliphilus AHT 1]
MNIFERFQVFFILAAVALGLLLGNLNWVAANASLFITPFLMAMLFGVFLQVPLNHLGTALKDFRFTGLSMAMNFIWTPALAFLLGYLFLGGAPDLWVGLIMLMVTPCTDWYIVFTNIACGNVPLATVQLPWKLLLQLLLLPIYLLLLAGAIVEINTAILFTSLVQVLVVPFILALITRRLLLLKKNESWLEAQVLPKVSIMQFVFLALTIMAMFASQGEILLQNPAIVLRLLPPIILFFAINFLLGQGIGRLFKFSYENVACFNFTTLARNSPLALAIAVSAFPDRPLIALVLIIGPLIELPVLTVIAQVLLFLRKKEFWPN